MPDLDAGSLRLRTHLTDALHPAVLPIQLPDGGWPELALTLNGTVIALKHPPAQGGLNPLLLDPSGLTWPTTEERAR